MGAVGAQQSTATIAAGFDCDALVEGPIAAVDGLLGDYGLPNGAPAALFTRRNALARHIGTPRA